MANLALEVRDLKKFFTKTGQAALDGVSFEIKKGSFFGLLGPNGAGKSTFINILSSCTNADSGSVAVLGMDLKTRRDDIKRILGIVPQEIVFDPFLTPFEALDFYAGFFGIPKQKRRTMEILDAMGLVEHKDKNLRMLSGGMKRRLLVAKALVQDPEIIVLDEPTAGVDIELRRRLWDYILKLNKEQGKTIILTTHYLEEVEELCDELVILNKGRTVYNGSKADLQTQYRNKSIFIKTNATKTALDAVFEKDALKGLEIDNNGLIKLTFSQDTRLLNEVLDKIRTQELNILELTSKEAEFEDIFRQIINS
jgi:ABC-2 type transport system ATP-binding protein